MAAWSFRHSATGCGVSEHSDGAQGLPATAAEELRWISLAHDVAFAILRFGSYSALEETIDAYKH
jgi:hypothetical protein